MVMKLLSPLPNSHLPTPVYLPGNQFPQCSCIAPKNKPRKTHSNNQNFNKRKLTVASAKAQKDGDENAEDPSVPSWAKPGSEELPPWARQEAQKEASSTFEVPFFAYLLASAITAIAAIGSIFEYVNEKPIFGVLGSDSALYAPILGFFAITGIPSSAYLWFKSVQVANKEAEEQDRKDGYL